MKIFIRLCAYLKFFFSSYRTMAVLLSLYVISLAVATWIESCWGSVSARVAVYNSIWFYLLQLLMVINFLSIAFTVKLWQRKKYGTLLFHLAFVWILAGAWITAISGIEGSIHLREGKMTREMLTRDTYLNCKGVCAGQSFSIFHRLDINPLFSTSFSECHTFDDDFFNISLLGTHQDISGVDILHFRVVTSACDTIIEVPGRAGNVGEPVSLEIENLSLDLSYGAIYMKLPFSIILNDFRLVRYPGSESPSSYESDLTIITPEGSKEETIYMNRVVSEQGYRLYQTSYDRDEKGSVLSVNKDQFGTLVSYLGYLFLLIGILGMMFERNSRFRELGRQLGLLSKNKSLVVVIFLFFSNLPVLKAEENVRAEVDKFVLPEAVCRSWAELQVQSPSGRIEPVDTYARAVLRKISKSDSYDGYSAVQVFLGIIFRPDIWNRVPFIRQTSLELHQLLGTSGNYIAFFDAFDASGQYKLAEKVQAAYSKSEKGRSRMEKDILKLDEKINIIFSLQQGRMLPLFPGVSDERNHWFSAGDDLRVLSGADSLFVAKVLPWFAEESNMAALSGEWGKAKEIIGMIKIYQKAKGGAIQISDSRIHAELLYNKIKIFEVSAFLFISLGLLLLGISLYRILNQYRWKSVLRILIVLACITFGGLTFGIALRWYISGQAPWANAYESMVYIGWSTAFAGLLFLRRSQVVLSLALFFAGVILFVAHLNWMDPEITPLVPVLKSYWLMIHVAVITASYGFFGMSFLIGFLSLILMAFRKSDNLLLWNGGIRELRIINEMSLYIGVALLSAGIFLGAVWANESWGRYWGWDPKETWALITLIIYAFILHSRFLPILSSAFAFSCMSVVAMLSVWMTYFGVNYYLSGLHSYGRTEVPPALNIIWVVYLLIAVVAIVAGKKEKMIRMNKFS